MTDPSSTFATPRVAAGALFLGHGRVLLVCPSYKNTWDILGGYVERGESPAAAAAVRLPRNSASTGSPTDSTRWTGPHEREGDKLLFLFDCGNLGDDEHHIRLDGHELDRWEWVPLDRLENYVVSRIAHLIRAAVHSSDATY